MIRGDCRYFIDRSNVRCQQQLTAVYEQLVRCLQLETMRLKSRAQIWPDYDGTTGTTHFELGLSAEILDAQRLTR